MVVEDFVPEYHLHCRTCDVHNIHMNDTRVDIAEKISDFEVWMMIYYATVNTWGIFVSFLHYLMWKVRKEVKVEQDVSLDNFEYTPLHCAFFSSLYEH